MATNLTPEAYALLETIAGPESAGDYNVIYGGGKFEGYSDHPREYVTITSGPNKGRKSSAAGKYQFLGSTWDGIAKDLGLTDFSPANQDAAAWELARQTYKSQTGRDLQSDLTSGNTSQIPAALKSQWTSLPGGIEQGITGSAFQNAYVRNMATGMRPGNPALDAIGMATAGVPAAQPMLGTPAGFLGINMATQGQPAPARLPDIGPSGGPTLDGGKVAPVPQTRPQAAKNPLQALFGGIVGEDGKLKIPDIKTMFEEGGKNLTNFMKDPRVATRAGLDMMGKNINSGLADWMTNDRMYKGITLGNMMTPGAQRVNTHQGGKNLGTGFLYNPGSANIGQRNFDAQVHGGQNMDVYRANAAARASGSSNPVMVSMGSRQAGEAPNGMRDTGGGRFETDTGGVYYDRHLSR